MNAIVKTNQNSLLVRMAKHYNVEPTKMLTTLKATAFRGEVTNEQMIALLIVAEQYNLNPWLKQIYAFPDRSGIVPVVGVDGWARIINEHPQFDGMDFEQNAKCCTCRIYRKDRAHPTEVTEYMAECKRDTAPWKSHPNRMLRHKAMIQCARLAFAFTGIYDEDEAQRIVEAHPSVVHAKPSVAAPRAKSGAAALEAKQEPSPESAPGAEAPDAEFIAALDAAKADANA